jgi:hypothetical protein
VDRWRRERQPDTASRRASSRRTATTVVRSQGQTSGWAETHRPASSRAALIYQHATQGTPVGLFRIWRSLGIVVPQVPSHAGGRDYLRAHRRRWFQNRAGLVNCDSLGSGQGGPGSQVMVSAQQKINRIRARGGSRHEDCDRGSGRAAAATIGKARRPGPRALVVGGPVGSGGSAVRQSHRGPSLGPVC